MANSLWQISVLLFTIAVVTTHAHLEKRQSGDYRCLKCDEVSDPSLCDSYTICGHDEVCYSREFVTHHNQKSYRLGCESDKICKLYEAARNVVIGRKRNIFDEINDPAAKCFNCCRSDECNRYMCASNSPNTLSLGTNVHTIKSSPSTTSTTPTTSTTTPTTPLTTTTMASTTTKLACLSGFTQWNSSCYQFNMAHVYWSEARNNCRASGADLVSINSRAEDRFIVSHLAALNPPDTIRALWIGAFYNGGTARYEWVDGSDVTFSRFNNGRPRPVQGYNLELFNPAISAVYSGWAWSSDLGSVYKRGGICEMMAS